MPVIAGLRETVKHLKADEIQVAKPVIIPLDTTCDCMFSCIKNQAAIIRFVFDMLNFEHDAFLTLVERHDIRGDALANRFRESRVHERDSFNAITAIKLQHCIEKIYRNRLVFRISEKNLKNIVVINVHVFIAFIVLRDTSGNVTSVLVSFADILKHFCILRFIHKSSFAAFGRLDMRVRG